MPTDQSPKQVIAQRIKDATNILVTVSHDPSVDELSAALALTLMLDKLGKTPTAVVSGKIPTAIEFLNPGKTFDTNVDGLRDFIIALDKTKADRLRYKVEDDVVRVFITPYRTTITEKDLTFSQGDFNVDLIVAFGVEKREDLDAAITAHGRILHDASIVTISQMAGGSSLGEVDWNDTEASSLCEMLMSLSESLQSGLLDEPIATAILTGLVSSTDRFRNDKTSSKVMTMAAQLMASGANQQLIAEKLEEATSVGSEHLNSTAFVEGKESSDKGEMKVEHDESQAVEFGDTSKDAVEEKAEEVASDQSADAIEEAQEQLEEAGIKINEPVAEQQLISKARTSSWKDAPGAEAPSTGGTLNATTEQAREDSATAEEDDKNRVILSHGTNEAPIAAVQTTPAVINATGLTDVEPTVQDIFAASGVNAAVAPANTVLAPVEPVSGLDALVVEPAVAVNPTLADLEQEVKRQEEQATGVDSLNTARAAVDAAFVAQPFSPAGQPLSAVGAQPLGDVAHNDEPQVSGVQDPVMPSLPPLPPMPDFSTLPPLPGQVAPAGPILSTPMFGLPEQQDATQSASPTVAPLSSTTDPSEFKLPGQQ